MKNRRRASVRSGLMTRWPPCWRSPWSAPALRLPTAPMSARPAAAASRRSSRPTTARPRSCRRRPTASAKTPDRMAHRRRRRKLVSARGDAGRRQRADRGPRIALSAAEPERQPAVGGERCASGAAATQRPPTARMPNNEPRKIRTLSVKGDRRRRRHPGECAATAGETGTAAPAATACSPRRAAIRSANASANTPLSLTPGAPSARSGACTAGSLPPTRRRPPAAAGGYVVQVSSQKNRGRCAGLLSGAAEQVPERAGLPLARDQTRRSRRKGRILSRHVSVPFGSADRGDAVLRQPRSLPADSASSKGINGRFLDP